MWHVREPQTLALKSKSTIYFLIELNDGIGVGSDCSSPSQFFCGYINEERGKGDYFYFGIFLSPLVTRVSLQDQNVKTSGRRKWMLLMTLKTKISELWDPKNRPANRSHSQRTPTILRLLRELEPVPPQDRRRVPLMPYHVSHLRSWILHLELELAIPSSTSLTGVSFFMYLYVCLK